MSHFGERGIISLGDGFAFREFVPRNIDGLDHDEKTPFQMDLNSSLVLLYYSTVLSVFPVGILDKFIRGQCRTFMEWKIDAVPKTTFLNEGFVYFAIAENLILILFRGFCIIRKETGLPGPNVGGARKRRNVS